MLVKYIRAPKKYEAKIEGSRAVLVEVNRNRPIGVIVATGKGKVGWSLCNANDKFDKKLGKEIAVNRAEFYDGAFQDLDEMAPKQIHGDLINMLDRSLRYFK